MEIIKEDEKSVAVIEPKTALPEVFDRWLANHLSKGTQAVYSGSLKEFVGFLNEKKIKFSHPSEIKPAHLIKYRDWLFAKEHSPKTINRKLSALSSLFKELRHEQIISLNPAESVKRPPDDIKKVRTSIKDKEVKPILDLHDEDTRQGLQNKTILTLLAYTAQRVSTIRVLQVKSVGEVDGVLVLTLKIKGGKIRHLPLPHEPARLVRKILAFKTSPDDYLFTPQRGTHKGQNKPISSVAIWYLIKNSLKKAGFDESRSAHSFRRMVLTRLLNGKNGGEAISAEKIRDEVSFHSSLDTLTLYKIDGETKMTENPILGIVYSK